MPTIAQELQTLDEVLSTVRSYNDAPETYKRRCQLTEMVCAVKTWQNGNTNKRIVTVSELRNVIGFNAACWALTNIGHPELFHEENLTLSWTDTFEWPFVKVTLTNGQDKDDCFKYNAQRMEAP
jgi:N-acyl-L-homoserine lactone synthetase